MRRLPVAFGTIAVLTVSLTGCGLFGHAETPQTPTPTPTSSVAEKGSIKHPLAFGDVIAGDGWKVTVNSVTPDATALVAAANQFNPKPGEGEKYLLINVTITRTGSTAAHPFDVELGYVTTNGVTIRESEAQAPERIDMLAELQSKGSMTGNIAFLVPVTAEAGVVTITPGDREARKFVALK